MWRSAAMEAGFRRLILPKVDAAEAAVAPGLQVYGVECLCDLVALLNGATTILPEQLLQDQLGCLPEYGVDYADVKGQARQFAQSR